jgi:hypothetical protein
MLVPIVLAVVGIQLATGAYLTERGAYSDEAAHFLNGLVLRDYVYSGFSTDPLSFAREYYAHYPKIAPLMWPPLFHGLLGIWLLPGWPAQPAAIALLGMFTAWTAWRLYTIVSTFASIPVALGAVGFFVVTPAVIHLSGSVMVDIVVAAFTLEATYWLCRYFARYARRDAVMFGLMAACSCLAKGNGVAIVLAPFVLILMTRKYRALMRPGLYLAAAVVVVVAVPLLAMSAAMDASIGDFGPITARLVLERVRLYAGTLTAQIGLPALAFAALGTASAFIVRRHTSSTAALYARGLAALVVSGWLFHLLNPHTVSTPRYITLTFAPLYGLAGLGVMTTCRPVRTAGWRWAAQLVVFVALAASHIVERPVLAAPAPLGYRSVVAQLSERGLAGVRVLVVSDELGEGAFVAELAVRNARPRPMAIRGSKLLVSEDWMGRNQTSRFNDTAGLLAELEAMHVAFIILDASAEAQHLAYWPLAHDLVTNHPDGVEPVRLEPVAGTRGPERLLAMYHLKNRAPGPPKPPSVEPGSLPTAFGTQAPPSDE